MNGLLKRLLRGKPKYPRKPAFAGHMYPEDPNVLRERIAELLEGAPTDPSASAPRAIVSPHADLAHSGGIAASAWRAVEEHADAYSRVVLASSTLRIPFRGPAVAGFDAWRSPLGDVWSDMEGLNALMALEPVRQIDGAHEPEPALELQLPFLTRVLPKASVVPVLMGDGSWEQMAQVFETIWSEDTLVVVATQLSIGVDLEEALEQDARTSEAIAGVDREGILRQHVTARAALQGLLAVAKDRGMSGKELARSNSSQVSGVEDEVIGYGAWSIG